MNEKAGTSLVVSHILHFHKPGDGERNCCHRFIQSHTVQNHRGLYVSVFLESQVQLEAGDVYDIHRLVMDRLVSFVLVCQMEGAPEVDKFAVGSLELFQRNFLPGIGIDLEDELPFGF
ncbi:hypothetical protein ES703_37656 [subsurface metagenome]